MKSIAEIIGSKSYQTLLKDERWIQFSKDIKQQFNFCECCKRSGIKLNVHHLFYDFDRKPWEYSKRELLVLCETCHTELHRELSNFRKYVFRYLSPGNFKVLNGALLVGLTQYDPLVFVHSLAEFVSNPRLVNNHAATWISTSRKEL